MPFSVIVNLNKKKKKFKKTYTSISKVSSSTIVVVSERLGAKSGRASFFYSTSVS